MDISKLLTSLSRKKKYSIFLLNDNINSFDYVIHILSQTMPLWTKYRAEQAALIIHNVGELEVRSGYPPEICLLYATLHKSGLTVDIRPTTK